MVGREDNHSINQSINQSTNQSSTQSMEQSAGPCLSGAPRLRVSNTFRISTIIGHAFTYQPSAVKLFTGLENVVIWPRHPPDSGSVTRSRIRQISKPVTRTEKLLPSLHKTTKTNPEIPENDFCEKLVLQYLSCENLDLGAPSVQISTQKSNKKVTWKQARKQI